MTGFFKNILQLVLSPSSGWEDVAASDPKPQELAAQCMYPLLGAAAVAVFLQMVYDPEISLSTVLIRAVSLFVSYFVTYFFAMACMKEYLWKLVSDEDVDGVRVHTMVVYALCLLAISSIVCNLLPLSVGLPYLLPLAVGLILWKSANFLRVDKNKEWRFVLLILLSLILPPILIQTLFDTMLSI